MSETDRKALAELVTPKTCTEVGEALWAGKGANCTRQSFARPAGKIIKRLVAAGLAQWTTRGSLVNDRKRLVYVATTAGLAELRGEERGYTNVCIDGNDDDGYSVTYTGTDGRRQTMRLDASTCDEARAEAASLLDVPEEEVGDA